MRYDVRPAVANYASPRSPISFECEPRVELDAPWYRVGVGWTTCPHLAAIWARESKLPVEGWSEHRLEKIGEWLPTVA